MNVYRIYILLDWFDKKGEIFFKFIYVPLLMIWQKGGEKVGVLYMHVYAWFPMFMNFLKRLRILYIHVYVIYIHVYFFFNWYQSICILFSIDIKAYMLICANYFMHTLNIFIVYCYAWIKGELLWSLSFNHAYITPWVLSSSKRWEIVGPKAHHSSFDDD